MEKYKFSQCRPQYPFRELYVRYLVLFLNLMTNILFMQLEAGKVGRWTSGLSVDEFAKQDDSLVGRLYGKMYKVRQDKSVSSHLPVINGMYHARSVGWCS